MSRGISIPATRRPAEAGDDPFLRELYASTRSDLDGLGWPDDVRAAFCESQWLAQRSGYRAAYPNALAEIIMHDDTRVGRLVLALLPDEARIVDIAVVPSRRGRGIGRGVIEDVQREAAATGRVVRLHVEVGNAARGLYERLGFVVTGEVGLHTEMTWRP